MADGSGAEIYWPVLGTAIKVAYSVSFYIFFLSKARTQKLTNSSGYTAMVPSLASLSKRRKNAD
jgi:hypothetical protein